MALKFSKSIRPGLLAILAIATPGCNLIFDLGDYPYEEGVVIEMDADRDQGLDMRPNNNGEVDLGRDMDMDMALEPDLPIGKPNLIITEILINTSIMENEIASGELGEYIEVKNVGEGPADPRQISFRLTNLTTNAETKIAVAIPSTPEQVEIYGALKPIEPGGYFVFTRYQVPQVPLASTLEEGFFYDYGRYSEGTSLSNSSERLLEMQYFDGTEIRAFDSLRWSSGKLVPSDQTKDEPWLVLTEDVAISVRRKFETVEGNDTPDAWCEEHTPSNGEGTFFGSPGFPANCP